MPRAHHLTCLGRATLPCRGAYQAGMLHGRGEVLESAPPLRLCVRFKLTNLLPEVPIPRAHHLTYPLGIVPMAPVGARKPVTDQPPFAIASCHNAIAASSKAAAAGCQPSWLLCWQRRPRARCSSWGSKAWRQRLRLATTAGELHRATRRCRDARPASRSDPCAPCTACPVELRPS